MQRALRTRDAGLRKVSTVTRVLIVGAVAATGLFTTLAAGLQPGRTKVAGSVGRARSASSSSSANAGSGVDANLSPPAALPDPSYQYSAPVVVSGAS